LLTGVGEAVVGQAHGGAVDRDAVHGGAGQHLVLRSRDTDEGERHREKKA